MELSVYERQRVSNQLSTSFRVRCPIHITLNLADSEILGSNRQVRMDCFPMTMELFVGDFWEFTEPERELYAWLVIGLCIVRKLIILEVVIDLLMHHLVSCCGSIDVTRT